MKNTFLIRSGLWFITLICFVGEAKSQNATYNADFPEISTSGFYKIALSPSIVSKTGSKFNRIRIYDGQNDVPYLIKKYPLSATTAQFHQLPIVERTQKDSLEAIVFGNPDSVKLTNVHVTVKRAWAAKRMKVSGSSDGRTWYVVRSEFLMNLADGAANNNPTEINYTLDLPLTNYRFYKIECNNKDDLAINILSIGYFSSSKTVGSLVQLPVPRIDILKTNDKSRDLFQITFPEPYLVSRLVFNVRQPHLFHRNILLYTHNPLKQTTSKRKRKEVPPVPFGSFILSSKDLVSAIEVDDVYSNRFFVLVENQDNPSLEIESVQGYYHPYYLKAYLESGKKYALNIAGTELPAPAYDLANFDHTADDQIKTLELKTLTEQKTPVITTPEPFFKSKIWLGAGLLFVSVILAYACFQMVRNLKR